MHTAGGQGPYLSLRARTGRGRASVDRAVEVGRLVELPSVRGCTMLVPAADAALALRAGRRAHDDRMAIVRKECAIQDRELGRLSDAILGAVASRPIAADVLRERVELYVRNLGTVGKKLGFATTLPVAVSDLQVRGLVRRLPTTGR